MNGQVNRRKFLTLNLEAAVGFLGNVLLPEIEQERDYFRPPGAGDELSFLTFCTRCGVCRDVCPEQSISLFTVSSGAKLAHTPYLDPNLSPCTFCGKCIDACKVDALSKTSLSLEKAIGKARIIELNCLVYKGVICDYCVQACPRKGEAIRVENGKPLITSGCDGCGLCVKHCISDQKAILVELLS
ncbi:4Fe-4S dicluster domain-containing protein [Neobacillus notoginsengisoli]|uniref:4Fe-4S dicluster domain-containing protein n=1 Tax=Neobacillus notoginsengisoli TaxID=1578198 RepID=A0A417YRV5_9BACI|nr:4Fe-4S dicluster domain-containing protein [Neobacillus notoginsengisoli]RHW38020.1 4Fe-4S dicluster domain-containing protein [Neobacillus notoginsengisoli]